MNLRQRSIRSVAWSGVQTWGRQLVSFVVFVMLSRLLPPEAFGLVAMASVVVAFVQVFVDQGFGSAIIQHANLTETHLDTAFWTNLGVSTVLTLLTMLVARSIAAIYSEPQLTPILYGLSLTFPIASLYSTQEALLRRTFDFKNLAIRSLIAMTIGGVISVGMAIRGFGVWSLVGLTVCSTAISAILLWGATPWRPSRRFSTKHFRELFSFGANILGANLLSFFSRRSDDFLIGVFLGPTILGYYTVAYRVLLVGIQVLAATTTTVALPAFSRLQHDATRLRNAYYDATQITSLIALPAFVGLALIAPELVTVIYGERWLQSIPIMQVLCLIGVLQSVFYYNGIVLVAVGKPSWNLALTALFTLASVIGFLIAVQYGILAVAISYVLRGYLLAPIAIKVVSSAIPMTFGEYLKLYTSPLVGTIIMTGCIIALKFMFIDSSISEWPQVAIYVLTGGAVYLCVIALLDRPLLRVVQDIAATLLPKRARIH